jgi:coenzyme F420 hydrogenase subunit beta
MLRVMGLDDPSRLSSVRYRGNGWPGKAVARARGNDGSEEERRLSYDASWGWILQRYRQWRCYVCADHTGEFADVSVGDPWYRPIPRGEPGRSLVLARTERGVRFVEQARRAGYLELEGAEPWLLPASQMNLLEARGSVWARTLVCRALGAEAPRYRRMPIHRAWWRYLSLRQKAQSMVGTVKRVFRKRLRERLPVRPLADPGAASDKIGAERREA